MSEKSLNIIVLDAAENIIQWLDSDMVDIVETNKIETVRSISMSVPLEDGYAEQNPWFNQGNKIFIPNTLGIKSCLYVINTSYTIDYLEKNMVQIEAEEVLTELNYEVIELYPEEPLEITRELLIEWFGEYYEIGEIDAADSNKDTINPYETLTLMDLLRMIEEKTNRVFITEYSSNNNIIDRTLHLKSIANLRTIAKTEYLDLNWNLKSLDLDVSEENTFTAMAPILSRKENGISTQSALLNSSSNMVSASDSLTSTSLETKEDALAVLNAWKEHEVEYRDYIPMICEKQQDGSVEYTAYWYAPFEKKAGELFIRVPNETDANYQEIIPRYLKEGNVKINPKVKMGTVTTSETDPNAIYNVCANKLLDKLHPVFKLKVEVEDIQDILGINNLGYTLYETLYVRPPRFTYYVPCYVTATKKNPHQPGSNTITVETDIKGLYTQQETEILSNDVITSAQEKETQIGGLLLTDTSGIADGLISINVRLQESFSKIDYDLQQQVEKFNPETETYTFTDDEIKKVEKKLHKDVILNKISSTNYYNMRSIDGKVYAVPYKWAEAIYNTRNQAYINSDDIMLNAGKFKKSITVHYYPNSQQLLQEYDNIKYYPSYFYDYYSIINTAQNADPENVPTVVSSEHQTGPNCVPAAASNISSYFKDYHTEGEMKKIFSTTTNGTPYINIIPGLEKLGYTFSVVPFTKENIEQYVAKIPTVGLILVNSSALGYTTSENHAVVIVDWSYTNGIENMKCVILDSNKPLFNPRYAGRYTYGVDSTRLANDLINACSVEYRGGVLQARSSGVPVMIVVNPPLTYEDDEIELSTFRPDIQSYMFTAESIERAFSTLPGLIHSDKTKDYFTQYIQMTDTNGKTYAVPGKWVMSLAYAYMYYYRNNWTYVPQLKFKLTSDGAATKYYNHLDTDYDWFSPCYPEKADKPIFYTLSTILFYAGFIVPPGKLTINDNYVSYTDMNTIISQNSSNLYCFLVDATKANIKKYLQHANNRGTGLFNVQLVLKVKSSGLDNLMQATYADSYSQRMYSHYIISIMSVDSNDDAKYLLTNGNGCSPTNRYDVSYQNANTSPWRVISIDDLVLWHNNAQGLQEGDSGKMLVVSMFSQSEIDSWEA